MPEKAKEKSQSLNLCPSTFYALELLEKSGVVIVPGEGFGQKQGSYHFRLVTHLGKKCLNHI